MSERFNATLKETERKRLEEAYELLSEKGCVKSRTDMLVKLMYFVLLQDNTTELCKTLGQSTFALEQELKEKQGGLE